MKLVTILSSKKVAWHFHLRMRPDFKALLNQNILFFMRNEANGFCPLVPIILSWRLSRNSLMKIIELDYRLRLRTLVRLV